MKHVGLGVQVFMSFVLVVLCAVVAVGLIARDALARAFDAYLAGLPDQGGVARGRGMGRMMLGAAEQTFLATVNNSVYLAAGIAVLVAAIVALLLTRYLTRPIRRLEHAAEELAGGDLTHRVDVAGPAEVAALGRAFNRMADSLSRAEELRRRLVADVSHELRNPIAAARAQAEGMVDGVIPADPARLGSLVDDLEHLSALVDDLHVLTLAESGRLPYDMRPLDLGELVGRECERAGSTAPRDIAVVCDLPPQPVEVVGDATRLSEVLRNLLSNAIRHTPHGSVTVAVRASGGQVEVQVVDTGEGIAEGDLVYVFERFYRADAARAADTGGAGLGLAISRRIVEDHGGTVFATHNPGGGAIVGFRLPNVTS
jgi:signal transduction histidine kinase